MTRLFVSVGESQEIRTTRENPDWALSKLVLEHDRAGVLFANGRPVRIRGAK